jgi:hypothetical protein
MKIKNLITKIIHNWTYRKICRCGKPVLDISSKKSGIKGLLSNYTERHFHFDGVSCHSIESVLQSFKFESYLEQQRICELSGKEAKKAGQEKDWKPNQTLYWQEVKYKRNSDDYRQLLDRLYLTVFIENKDFRKDIKASKGAILTHSIGNQDITDTVLTEQEFCDCLMRLRRLLYSGKMTKETESILLQGAPDYISEIIRKLKKAKTRLKAYEILNKGVEKEPSFRCVDDIYFVEENYLFKVTLTYYTEIKDFDADKKENPDVEETGVIDIGDSGASVIVVKYRKQDTVDEVASQQSVNQTALDFPARFFEDNFSVIHFDLKK